MFYFSVSVSQSMLAKLVFRLVTPAGNCTVSSMGFNLTVRCLQIRRSALVMTLSTRSSAKPGLESTSHERSLSTWNLPLLVSRERFGHYLILVIFVENCK